MPTKAQLQSTNDDLAFQIRQLEAQAKIDRARIQSLKDSMQRADRAFVNMGYGYGHDGDGKMISVPLTGKQATVMEEWAREHCHYGDYEREGDSRKYEEYHETDVLAEYSHYMVRYYTDLQGNITSTHKVWGLLPVPRQNPKQDN